MDKPLRIGELAAQLGLNPKTIRYYEEIGETLGLRRDGVQPCEHVTALLDRKIDWIDQQLRVLEEMRQDLVALRQRAAPSVSTGAADCRIIEHRERSHPSSAERPRRSPLPVVSRGRSADSVPGGGRRNSRRTVAVPAAGADTLPTSGADRPVAPRARRASKVS